LKEARLGAELLPPPKTACPVQFDVTAAADAVTPAGSIAVAANTSAVNNFVVSFTDFLSGQQTPGPPTVASASRRWCVVCGRAEHLFVCTKVRPSSSPVV
jgi:hypothetical protein